MGGSKQFGYPLLLSLCLLIAIGALLVGCGSAGGKTNEERGLPRLPASLLRPSDPLSAGDITVSLQLSREPGEAPVYLLHKKTGDEEYARSVAAKFGEFGEPTYVARLGTYTFDNPGGTVVVFGDWDFSYIKAYPRDFVPPYVQSTDQELRVRAEAFLQEHSLLPEEARFARAEDQWGGREKRVIFVHRDSPITGPGGPTMIVTINGAGDVVGVDDNWSNIELFHLYPILSEQEAFERLMKGMVGYSSLHSGAEIVSVEMVYLGIDGPGSAYLAPWYRFSGSVKEQSADVCALTDEYAFPK